MNKGNIERIKKYGLCFGLFLTMGLLLWGTRYMISSQKNDYYINEAKYIIKNSTLCAGYKNIKFIKKTVNFSSFNMNFCNAVLEVKINDKPGYIVFVNMSGKYGIYQGMFLYLKEVDAPKSIFCGLAGHIVDKPAEYYGITSLSINIWQKKLDAAFKNNLKLMGWR